VDPNHELAAGAGNPPRRPPPSNGLVASVIVPVRDGEGPIRELLENLHDQTMPRDRFEVVIGDDGSATQLNVTDDNGWVRVTRAAPANSYAARNRAAGLAHAPVLAFCDSDCTPEPRWLEAGVRALEGADLAAGQIRFTIPERRTIWTLLDIDTFLDQERAVRAGSAVTANLFVRRELFERMGRFDDAFPNQGDQAFIWRCLREDGRLVFVPEAVVWHPTRDTARALLRKLWTVNWCYGARAARDGARPARLRLRSWIPILPTLRSRRHAARSISLDRRRLAENGITPTLWDDLRALPLIYLVLPYVMNGAQLWGWWTGSRRR
jgi:glycosyltransferase involved in cell wall biosynthesis